MRSFDLYDTLVTRRVARPQDVFRLVEEIEQIPGFARLRIQAESEARLEAAIGEVSFDEIYRQFSAELPWLSRARATELRLERELVVAIRENVQRLRRGDIVISDMYLRKDLLHEICAASGLDVPSENFVVSCEVKVTKAHGSVWELIRRKFGEPSLHVGDNLHGDVEQSIRNGIRAEHFTGAELNKYEGVLADHSLDGSVIAGLSKAARLSLTSAETDANQRALLKAFASVFAPLFVCFVEHVLNQCVEQGTSRVFFLARDGQLLFKIAQRLIAARGLPLQAAYLYGSRHALHLPGFVGIEGAESWIIEDTQSLSLRDIALRTGVPLRVVLEAASPWGLGQSDANIPRDARHLLRQVIRDPKFVQAIESASRAALVAASEYYRQSGITDEEKVALVDVGWNGRMQESLRNIFAKMGSGPANISGYYLCLSRKAVASNRDTLSGFLYDPDRDLGQNAFDGFRAVFETALSADHPTTQSFRMDEGRVEVEFGREYSHEEMQLIQFQQEIGLSFVDQLVEIEAVLGRKIAFPREIIMNNLKRFLSRPSRDDGIAFLGRTLSDSQVETATKPIVVKARLWSVLFDRSSLGHWPNGSIAAGGHGRFLRGMELARRTKRVAFQGLFTHSR